MTDLLISHINSKIQELGFFGKIYGLCDILTKGEISYPAEFENNEYKRVSDVDILDGIGYHRKNGSIETEENEEESISSCDPFYQRTIPVRSVFVVRRDKINLCNDSYFDDKLSNLILNKIVSINNKQLRIDTGFDSIVIQVEEINTNRDEIFESEYSGMPNFFRYEYSYVMIDYSIQVTGALSCFNNYCE